MRKFAIFLFAVVGVFIVDQGIKDLFYIQHYSWESKCVTLSLELNRGVAFSMLEFLGDNLKWVQLSLVALLAYLAYSEDWLRKYPLSLGLIAGGAVGNLFDRFSIDAVVDYFYWHCGFNFAVFNFADVMIDLGIGLIILQELLKSRKEKK